MGGKKVVIVAGVGYSSAASAADIVAVVRAAGVAPALLAAPDFKDGAVLRQAAVLLALPLRLVDRAELAAVQARCVTFSAAAEASVGLGSVAEAAALAAAGPDGRLLVARISLASATCALAEGF